LQPGDHTEGDGAVPAQHDRHAAGADHLLDGVGDCESDCDNRVEVASRGSDIVGGEHLTGDITRVGHHQARGRQLVDEATGAKRGRRQLLSGMVSARASGCR